ncbi:hypothetical protein BTR22_19035 [Alkalihalophilus pseudofirmus]|uniref:hypothetical protein n=1 Tax=Alkalihalophilus pseudofirmus TaxID=79885 RepID=UPI0009529866|nr:hypothetical protein BTR22_19035 [Alkalihalophilus pseudofirmus]
MRKLKKPAENTNKIYQLCISRVKNKDLKERLLRCENKVVKAAIEYEEKVVKAQLHKIKNGNILEGLVTIDEMNKVYTSRMVPKRSPGRPVYEKILSAPSHGICPLCGQRTVTTLDHHLPKAEYPALSVVPINLVPSCKDCNTIKLGDIPNSSDVETIHPYFDDIEKDKWLYGQVNYEKSVFLTFKVQSPPEWSSTLGKRVENHFEKFELNELYSSHAAVELANIRYLLKQIHKEAGSEQVHSFLIKSAESREASHLNSWQSAMYRALAKSEWFCTEGLDYI